MLGITWLLSLRAFICLMEFCIVLIPVLNIAVQICKAYEFDGCACAQKICFYHFTMTDGFLHDY
jgi:hypothetical protein